MEFGDFVEFKEFFFNLGIFCKFKDILVDYRDFLVGIGILKSKEFFWRGDIFGSREILVKFKDFLDREFLVVRDFGESRIFIISSPKPAPSSDQIVECAVVLAGAGGTFLSLCCTTHSQYPFLPLLFHPYPRTDRGRGAGAVR